MLMAFNYTTNDIKAVLSELKTSENGLHRPEAARRLEHNGPNVLTATNKIPLWKKLLEPFLDVFVYILVFAAIISIIAKEPLDAIIIIAILVANAIIFYIQRFSSDRVLDKLKSFDKREVTVIRDGEHKSLDASQLVQGDIVLLEEGMQVPADGRVLHADQLKMNESALTGESAHVHKSSAKLTKEKPVYAQANMVFQGTLVAGGQGRYAITGTGNNTELGRIAHLVPNERQQTDVEKSIGRLFTRVAIGVGIIALVVFGLGVIRGISVAESLRYALSLTVSAIPEGLPLAISVVLIFGARKMAKQHALVRRLRAIEAFGQTSVILTDKTGTLTKNELELEDTWALKPKTDLKHLVTKSVSVAHSSKSTDGLELALINQGEDRTKGWQHKGLIPFDQDNRLSGAYWHTGKGLLAVVKGAPESLLAHAKLGKKQSKELQTQLAYYLDKGYRVLAIATQQIAGNSLPKNYAPKNLDILGLLVFGDTIRTEAKKAVATARSGGIDVVMLTGDHEATARHVGLETGIITDSTAAVTSNDKVIQGIKKDPLGSIEKIQVLARVLPEYKYDILRSLQHHHVVVMTGDGINDVPALSKANIGVAMGSGTDAAKEASDVILLDNNFASIVKAIEQGRAITANIKKMVYFLFSTNMSTIIVIIFSLVAGFPLPVLAVQVLWLNLVVDGIVVIPLGLEPAESDTMKRKPRKLSRGLFTNYDRLRVMTVAGTMAIITLVVFSWYHSIAPEVANTVAFSVLIAMQWANALNARSFTHPFWQLKNINVRLLLAVGAAIVSQIMLLSTPAGNILRLEPIGQIEWLLIACAPLIIIIVDSLYKFIMRSRSGDA